MVNFAELKAKAEKAKDASVATVINTRDRYTSAPSSKVTWDPNWKRAPPAAGGASTSAARPLVPRATRPSEALDLPGSPPYTPLPPPTRAASGYRLSHREPLSDAVDRIDWVNLSAEDKVAFFGWLDEFFSRYLGIEVGSGERRGVAPGGTGTGTPVVHRVQSARPPPMVNMGTRPKA